MAKFLLLVFYTLCWHSCECGEGIFKRNGCLTPRRLEGCEKTRYNKEEAHFYLFTRKNPENPEFLHDCGHKLPKNTNFDPKNPTEIIVHGYGVYVCGEAWMREMKSALLKRGEYNVILIDWSKYAVGDYYNARQGLKIAAKECAEFIDNIKTQTNVDVNNLHIIGHSLGAHFAGLVGQRTRIGRITGLEPAGPGYTDLPLDERLDSGDANYVDVIHTNAGRCLLNFGYIYPIGHDDFYVNDGTHQMSCYGVAFTSILKGDVAFGINALLLPTACFHYHSIEYYKVSINPEDCQFIGKLCRNYQYALDENCDFHCKKNGSNCSVMGMDWIKFYNSTQKKPRIFNVQTSFHCPYCIPDKMFWKQRI